MKICYLLLVFALTMSACDKLTDAIPTSPSLPSDSGRQTANSEYANTQQTGIPKEIIGFELSSIRGWLANIYPWVYKPEQVTVHPVARLWTPYQVPSSDQLREQCRQIKEYGGGAVVLEYSPNPDLGWHNYWFSTGFARECGPFFLLYEHINGTRFIPKDGGPKNMDDPLNRKVFLDDIDFMFKEVILRNQNRYITVNHKAVIYLWASSDMIGDFGSLLDEARAKYPVMFIGSGESSGDIKRLKMFDGFMSYTLGGYNSYMQTVQDYRNFSYNLNRSIRQIKNETGKDFVFIPTFQFAYDDSNFPGRSTPVMYASNKREVEYHAQLIKQGTGTIYSNISPFVIYSELPEGAAVIESQCLPNTLDTPNKFVGCGMARLEILKFFFGQ